MLPTFQKTAWIWFIGCGAWMADSLLSAHFRNWAHAQLAMMVAIVFLAAGFFYRKQS